jgi:transcriptional regulator with XRE-family HTH domain
MNEKAQRTLLAGVGLALDDAIREHRLSQGELAGLADVSHSTVKKLLSGQPVRLDLAVRIGVAVAVVDPYGEPSSSQPVLVDYPTPPQGPVWPARNAA